MLDADYGLKSFVEQLTAVNRGRAFFTNPETLGDYVLVDFIEHKRSARAGPRRSSLRVNSREEPCHERQEMPPCAKVM